MDYAVTMHVLKAVDKLRRIELDFQFMESLSPLQQVTHRLIWAELQKDINALWVFKEMFKPYDVLVLDGTVDFDL